MSYPGGKNGAGVFQRIISHMPPHRVYIEPFVGGAAILRLKRPAALSIACDLDRDLVLGLGAYLNVDDWGNNPVDMLSLAGILRLARSGDPRVSPDPAIRAGSHRQKRREDPPRYWLAHADGIELLERYPFEGDELVYCDPPYLHSTRSRRRLYQYEMYDEDHDRLLEAIRRAKARVMISGYWSEKYADALYDWSFLEFHTTNRAGQRTRECVWSNFAEPIALHDYRYLGEGFRERERIKRKKRRWVERLAHMPLLEMRALLDALDQVNANNATPASAAAPKIGHV